MDKTYWWCRACNKEGYFEAPEHFDFFEGYYILQDAHHEISPDCKERYYIRVSLEGPITEEIKNVKI